MAVGKATGIGIDNSLLDRLEQFRPPYMTQKVHINMLVEEALKRLEQQEQAPVETGTLTLK